MNASIVSTAVRGVILLSLEVVSRCKILSGVLFIKKKKKIFLGYLMLCMQLDNKTQQR